MRSQYAAAPTPPPPTVSFGTGAITIAKSGTYSAYLQLRNRSGVTTLSTRLQFTVNAGQSIILCIPAAVRQPATDIHEVILLLSRTSVPSDAVVVATYPGYQLDGVTPRSLPYNITLSRDQHLELGKILPSRVQLPQNQDLIHGMRRYVETDGQVLSYDAYKNRWDKAYIPSFSTYVTSSLSVSGCDRDISTIEQTEVITPDYSASGAISEPVKFWMVNDSNAATAQNIPAGTRVRIAVSVNGADYSAKFVGLMVLTVLGYANIATGALDTTNIPEVGVQTFYQGDQQTDLILAKPLPPGWAYMFQVQVAFQFFHLNNEVLNGSTIQFSPRFSTVNARYDESGELLGDYILAQQQNRRIVPNGAGLNALALAGSGRVASYTFREVPTQIVVGFAQGYANQNCVITNNGVCFVSSTVPEGSRLRARVSTVNGTGKPTSPSPVIALSPTTILRITVFHPSSIRSDYPDVIASNSNGTPNITRIAVFVESVATSQITRYAQLYALGQTSQEFLVGAIAGTGIGNALPTTSADFGLYAPQSFTAVATSGTSVFTAGDYRIAIAYVYENTITVISHDTVHGCIYEAGSNFAQVFDSVKYWAPGVNDIAALRAVPMAQIVNHQTRYVGSADDAAHFDSTSLAVDDGVSVIKPNELSIGSPGRWFVDPDYMDLSTDQTVGGTKTFAKPLQPRGAVTDIALATFKSTDTSSLFAMLISGLLEWGPGGSAAKDTKLERAGVNTLRTGGLFSAAGNIETNTNLLVSPVAYADANTALEVKKATDANAAIVVRTSGLIEWGAGGSTSRDTTLFRAGAQRLKTNGVIEATRFVGEGGLGNPTFTTLSAGTRVVLRSSISANSTDYAFGVVEGMTWYSVPRATTDFSHTFYGGTTELMRVRGDGSVAIAGNLTLTGQVTGGTWSATAIAPTRGGTGLTTAPAVGQTLVGNATGGFNLTKLAAGNGIKIESDIEGIKIAALSSLTSFDTALQYVSNGDENGIFYHLGRNYGSEPWVNPCTAGRVIITGSVGSGQSGLLDRLVDRLDSNLYTSNQASSFFTFDFGADYRCVITDYTLKSRGDDPVNGSNILPRSWKLRGSNDNLNWADVDTQVNNTALAYEELWLHIEITSGVTQGFRYIQIIQTGANSAGDNRFALGEIELYGRLRKSPKSGQLLIGNNEDYTLNNLTSSRGIAITNSPGGIAIASSSKVLDETVHVFANYGDTNGVLYYIGTNYGTESWINPHVAGRLTVIISSNFTNTAEAIYAAVDRANGDFRTYEDSPSFVSFDLGTKYRLVVDGYAFQTGNQVFTYRNWKLQGSNNNTDWVDLDIQTGNVSLSTARQWLYVKVNSSGTSEYRFIRFALFAGNPHNSLNLTEFELYGRLRRQPHPGQLLIGSDHGYVPNQLTAGKGIAIERSAGGIEISSQVSDELIFDYEAPADVKGVLYYFGTNYGKEAWANPHTTGRINITASSLNAGYQSFGRGSVASLVNRVDNDMLTAEEINAFFTFDFKENCRLLVESYAIKYGSSAPSPTSYIRNWKLRGSDNNVDWIDLDVQTNNGIITTTYQWLHIKVAPAARGYRFIQFLQTDTIVKALCLSELEFYGKLRKYPVPGQLLIGSGTDYVPATLTAGKGIAVENSAGGIAIASKFSVDVPLNYVSDGDENGVFYYIGCDYGRSAWTNPHTSGKITVTSATIAGGNVAMLVDRAESSFFAGQATPNFLTFDLGAKYKLAVNGYAIRSRRDPGAYFRNWKLRGSNDNLNWTDLNVQVNNTTLNTINQWLYIALPTLSADYRYLQILHNGTDSSGQNYICLGEVEFYGIFRQRPNDAKGHLWSEQAREWIPAALTELDKPQIFTRTQAIAPVTVPYTGIITLDLSQSSNFVIGTLTGNLVLSFTNLVVGASGSVTLVQDATGERAIALDGANILKPGGVAPTLSTAANSKDILYYNCDRPNEINVVLQKDFR